MKVRIEFDDGVETFEFKANYMNPHIKACIEALTQMMVKFPKERLWDLVFVESDGSKIDCIKQVRAITNLGLKEAKYIVETQGKIVSGVPREHAEELAKKFTGIGQVEIMISTEST